VATQVFADWNRVYRSVGVCTRPVIETIPREGLECSLLFPNLRIGRQPATSETAYPWVGDYTSVGLVNAAALARI
jgi:hypothetical protein